jgi:hypothetical protein
MTTAAAATVSKHLRASGSAHRTFSRPGLLRRVRFYLENSDWDERLLAHEQWFDRICGVMLIAAAIALVPVFINIIFR